MKYIVGIDEAGRGPLAGPVSISAVCVRVNFDKKFFKGIRDSKKISSKVRQTWLSKIKARKDLKFSATFVSARVIDRRGISWSLKEGVRRCLSSLEVNPKKTLVLLDGSLYAPKEFIHQKTIIGGDDKEPLISMASIVAKERRDRSLVRLSRKFPKYHFEIHKGYGTSGHRLAIKKYGLCDIHRQSFCKNVIRL